MDNDFGVEDKEGRLVLPTPERLYAEALDVDGIYLLENGMDMYLWICRGANQSQVVEIQQALLHDNVMGDLGKRVHVIANAIRHQRCKSAVMKVIRPQDPFEQKLFSMLVEDRTLGSDMSYVDFLCHVHKLIQSKLA